MDRYKIALTLGSGGVERRTSSGRPCPGPRPRHPRSKPALEGHGGTLRSSAWRTAPHAGDRRPHPLLRGQGGARRRPTVFGPRRPLAAKIMILTNGRGLNPDWAPGNRPF
ncbi:hypothetical protein QJS66_07765 [Kocuria rhizophila]|nr:hypothetical protein QJS66_07765 [Kocuria rhizophila]